MAKNTGGEANVFMPAVRAAGTGSCVEPWLLLCDRSGGCSEDADGSVSAGGEYVFGL